MSRQNLVHGVDQPVEEKIVQVADDAVQAVATDIARIEITSARGVPAPGILRIYQSCCEQFDDILFFDAGQSARVLQGFSRF